ncbi:MAG: hypothetical protein PWP72_1416 [Thermoanaerobacter sp.]|nr:hypothetical protein [Thermoanaerobacter sp.]
MISLSAVVDRVARHKRPALIVSACLGLITLFVLDVWILGTAAAWLHGLGTWLKGQSIFATPAEKAAAARAFESVSWYWSHPITVARAWLSGRPLSKPEVRQIWLMLNLAVLALAGTGLAWWKLGGYRKRWGTNNVGDRDIEKLRFTRVKFDPNRYLERTPENRIFLGLDDSRRPVTVPVARMVEHVHILGGSGTGKTSFAVVPICIQAIRRGMATVVVDFKGDKGAIQQLAREARAAGKKFFLFSLHPQIAGNTYNPLASGGALSKVERVMTALELVYEGEARFYSYCQQAVFLPLIKYLDDRGVRYTLRDIQEILKNPELVQELTGEEMSPGQIKGLTAALTPYADLEAINDPEGDIDLAEVMAAGDVAYFDLRSAVAPELASALGKMIAMDLQALAAFRTPQDRMALVAIDEFQNMACPAFRNIISKVRSAGYALVLANQALGDLRAVGEDFLNTVVTNTSTKIIFNVEDPGDAEYFARRSGQVVVSTHGFSTSREAKHPLATTSYGESVQEYDKHKIHSNVFLCLPFGKSVIFRRGEVAVLGNHAHLITRDEKDRLERMPYPEPERVVKQGVKTVNQLVEQMKARRVGGQARPRPRPGQPENAPVQAEEITM